jgi:CBS domain-containing protein
VTLVREVMTVDPTAVSPDLTVREAARLLVERDVGPLPVVDGEKLVGIVTDRDLVVRVLADDRDPATTTVGEIASTGVVTVGPEEDLEVALKTMAERQVRRLPVVENGCLVGILSRSDVAGVPEPFGEGAVPAPAGTIASPSTRVKKARA